MNGRKLVDDATRKKISAHSPTDLTPRNRDRPLSRRASLVSFARILTINAPSNVTIHRYEEHIAGRTYFIEVSEVSAVAVARANRPPPRHADLVDAVLRPDARGSCTRAEQMAFSRVRSGHSQYIIKGCMTQPARFRPLVWPCSIAAALAPLVAQRPSGALPRVHFVATGGTISNRDGGRLTAAELAKSMPGVERFAELTHEQFTNVASSELTLKQWLGLSKRVNEVFAGDKDLAGHCRHERHRHAGGNGVLPPPDRPRSAAGGGGRVDAQSRAPWAMKAPPTCSRASAWPPIRSRATRARWWSSTTRSTPRAT